MPWPTEAAPLTIALFHEHGEPGAHRFAAGAPPLQALLKLRPAGGIERLVEQ
jgi:hypothetical protein